MGILTSNQDNNQHQWCWLLLVVTVLQLSACSTPEQQIDELARQNNFTKNIMFGSLFEHVIYFKQSSRDNDSLHIYIEGDGRPWLTPRRIALKPAIHEPLMLKLMCLDDAPALYLGRPCYIGLSDSLNCQPWYWTSGRYSQAVVDSMQSVLMQYLIDKPFNKLVFLGHSGGGSLATLLAKRFSQTTMLVTIAGNIDTDEWVKFHDYGPLEGLNPINSLPLSPQVKQFHLMGDDDNNVPPELTLRALKKQKNTHLIVIPDYTHNCCWNQIWVDVLRCIKHADENCIVRIKPG